MNLKHPGLREERWILIAIFVLLVVSVSLTSTEAVKRGPSNFDRQQTSGSGAFLPPTADPWTSMARADTNGNGMPDSADEPIDASRSSNNLSLVSTKYRPLFPGQTTAALSNPQPGSLRFLTGTVRFTSQFGTQTIAAEFSNFDANGRPRTLRITDAAGSTPYVPPGKVRFTHNLPAVYTLNMIDGDNNGIYEAFRIEGKDNFTTLPATTINFVGVDINNDGKADFATIPWALSSVLGVQAKNKVPQIFIPMGDTDLDGTPDTMAFDFDHDGFPDSDLLAGPGVVATAGKIATLGGNFKLYFAQFGNGKVGTTFEVFSQAMLLNQSTVVTNATMSLRDDLGRNLTTRLNGEPVVGNRALTIPPGGMRVLKTDGQGPLTAGSATVSSDNALAGVILFGGSFGLAGVGNSLPMSGGFVAPMETNSATGTDMGIAVMNLETNALTATFQLADTDGRQFATARLDGANAIAAGGHRALFLSQLPWTPALNFSNLQAVLRVTTNGRVAGTVVQVTPSEYATLPVVPLTGDASNTRLNFAHFGTGIVTGTQRITSEIMLLTMTALETEVTLTVRDDTGALMTVDLNGETVNGTKTLIIPAGGLRILKTSGNGPLRGGSVAVSAVRPIAGVIIFGGDFGVAGVGSSAGLLSGFSAPIETNTALGTDTGIALMSLEESSNVTADVELYDLDGRLLATAKIDGDDAIRPGGHSAKFVGQLRWNQPVNFSNLLAVVKIRTNGRVAATVIQTRPRQFATMPVAQN
ncbi:MAG TPA: hypothetical protein VGK99_24305 [Acidobacteriota bacterium]|jgi:hypothetical protein